jgi:hypothetical protein
MREAAQSLMSPDHVSMSGFLALAIFELSVCLVACQQTAPLDVATAPAIDRGSFESCVDREANTAFRRWLDTNPDLTLYGYPINVENDIISACNPQLRPEGINDNIYTTNPDYLYINAAVEAQQKTAMKEKVNADVEAQRRKVELDAPRLKAVKEQEATAVRTYYLCLVHHAQILALASNESAEVIAQASFPSCSPERQAVLDVYRRNNDILDSEAMDMVDGKFQQSLLLEVIKARAQPAAPSETAPPKRNLQSQT